MANKDVSFRVSTQDNASGVINTITGKVNEITKSVQAAASPLKRLGDGFSNFARTVPGINLLKDGLSALKSTISDCTAAFAELERSTRALEFAESVNTQLRGAGQSLSEFAGEMSAKLSNVFSAGEIQSAIQSLSFDHSYDEIRRITGAAADLAAATGTTLSQAVDTLSATMSGRLSKELKIIAPELADLTKEQLAAGGAVDILSGKLAGLAGEMAGTASGAITAFKNTVGDTKELLGELFSDAVTPMRNFFTEAIGKMNILISKKNQLKDAREAVDAGTADFSQAQTIRRESIRDLSGYSSKVISDELADALDRAAQNYGGADEAALLGGKFYKSNGKQVEREDLGRMLENVRRSLSTPENLQTRGQLDALDRFNEAGRQMVEAAKSEREEKERIAELERTNVEREARRQEEAAAKQAKDDSDALMSGYGKLLASAIESKMTPLEKLNAKLDKAVSDRQALYDSGRYDPETIKGTEIQGYINELVSAIQDETARLAEEERKNSEKEREKAAQEYQKNLDRLNGIAGKYSGKNLTELESLQRQLAEAEDDLRELADAAESTGIDFSAESGAILREIERLAGAINAAKNTPSTKEEGGGIDVVKTLEDSVSDMGEWFGGLGESITEAVGGTFGEVLGWFGDIIGSVGEAFSDVLGPVLACMGSISMLNDILNPVNTIFIAMLQTLDPFVQSLLEPIRGALVIIGQTLGQILIPLLDIFTPAIELLCKAFVFLYNNAIVPVANGIITVLNWLYNGVATAINGIISLVNGAIDLVNKIPGVSIAHIAKLGLKGSEDGHLSKISTGDLAAAGRGSSSYGGSGSSYQGGASYTAARDVVVNINFSSSFVNGDAREIAVMLRDEIKAAEALGY